MVNLRPRRIVLALPAPGLQALPRRQPRVPVPQVPIPQPAIPRGETVVNADEDIMTLPVVRGIPKVPIGIAAKPPDEKKPKRNPRKRILEEEALEKPEEELPEGTSLLSVAGEELPKSAVGPALEFLEFCSAFSKPLKIKEVEPQMALREIVHGCKLKQGWQSQAVRVHVRLLSAILDDTTISVSARLESPNSWLIALKSFLDKKLSSQSSSPLSSPPLSPPPSASVESSSDSVVSPFHKSMHKFAIALEGGADGYLSLAVEEKLQLLNMLCNIALSTTLLRDHIKEVMEYVENRKEEEKKEIKAGKLKASTSEPNTEIRYRTRSALELGLANLSETTNSGAFRSDAVKTEAIVWDKGSRALWQLKGGDDRKAMVLQVISDIGGTPKEEWLGYAEKDKEALTVYLNQKMNDSRKARKSYHLKTSESHPLGSMNVGTDAMELAFDDKDDTILRLAANSDNNSTPLSSSDGSGSDEEPKPS